MERTMLRICWEI